MATLTTKTYAADGDSDTFIVPEGGCVVLMGDSDGSNFGGGTLTIKYTADGTNFTSDATTYTAMDIKNIKPEIGGLSCKITLSGATSPDLNLTVVGDN